VWLSGVPGSGLAGAIIQFFGMLWPDPRRFQVRVRVEPRDKPKDGAPEDGAPQGTTGTRVTVDLEDPRTGASIATKTLPASDFNEAASMVAGYVARQIFNSDPTTPAWCVGADGRDLAAMLLAKQLRAGSVRHTRQRYA